MLDRPSRKLRPMATRVRSGVQLDPSTRISRSIVKEVLTTRDAVLTSNAMNDERFKAEESIIGQQIHSAICVPLIHKGETLGVIHLECCSSEGAFTRSDLEQVSKIAMQASMAINECVWLQVAIEIESRFLSSSSLRCTALRDSWQANKQSASQLALSRE